MIKPAYPAIFELLGPEDSGKSTVAELFLEALPPECHVVLICTDTDSDLAKHLGLSVSLTMASVLEQAKASPLKLDTPETIDWLMTELVIDTALYTDKPNQEMICLGSMPSQLGPEQQSLVDFALPRLLQNAHLIIADGSIDSLKPSLKNFDIRPILVIRPEDNLFCETYASGHPNMHAQCILSKATGEDIPPAVAQTHFLKREWTLLGKIPRLPSPGENTDPVQVAFHDCLRRLDLSWQV